MFIDYISLMLINMVAGLSILAYYVYSGIDSADQKRWVPGFGMTGAIALTTGLHMIFTCQFQAASTSPSGKCQFCWVSYSSVLLSP